MMQQIWKQTSTANWAMLIFLVAYFFYLSHITTPVPNLINSTNSTEYQILYDATDKVPPTYVSTNYAFAGIVMVIIFGLTFIMKERKEGIRISEREAKKLILNEFSIKSKEPLKNNFYEFKDWEFEKLFGVLTVYQTIADKRKVKHITLGAILKNKETNEKEHYKIRVNPYEEKIDDIIKTNVEMIDSDKCPKCGKEYNEKVIFSEEFIRKRQQKKFMDVSQ